MELCIPNVSNTKSCTLLAYLKTESRLTLILDITARLTSALEMVPRMSFYVIASGISRGTGSSRELSHRFG